MILTGDETWLANDAPQTGGHSVVLRAVAITDTDTDSGNQLASPDTEVEERGS